MPRINDMDAAFDEATGFNDKFDILQNLKPLISFDLITTYNTLCSKKGIKATRLEYYDIARLYEINFFIQDPQKYRTILLISIEKITKFMDQTKAETDVIAAMNNLLYKLFYIRDELHLF